MITLRQQRSIKSCSKKSPKRIAQLSPPFGVPHKKSTSYRRLCDVSKDAVKSYPWSWHIHLERGKILLAAKRVKEALVDCERMHRRLKSDNNEAYLLRAKAYDLLGDKRRSANDRLISQQFQKTRTSRVSISRSLDHDKTTH